MPRIYREAFTPIERHRFVTERLGLRSDRRIVFLTTGGAGANNHIALLEVLKRYKEKYQAVVVCGRNQKVFLEASKWKEENPDFSCNITGYTNEIHLYMQAADFVVTRGGTTTCAEALHFECPIVFNGFGGVMPQEKLTVKYFMQDNAAVKISKAEDFDSLLGEWCRSTEKFTDLKRRFSKMRFQDDPRDTIRMLVDLAQRAASESDVPPLKVVG
nr:glycosyltransferase [Pelagicoccus albus]